MRVVDRSAWIEWLLDSDTARALRSEMPPRHALVVPTIVPLELSKWLLRESQGDDADRVIAYTAKCVMVPLDTRIALRATTMHRQHGLATADAIVYATAVESGADLLTCDAHFSALPGVVFVRKTRDEVTD